MKILFPLLLILPVFHTIQAQAPEQISYQAVLRDATGAVIANTTVGLKLTVLQGTPTGMAVYSETHNPTTNVNGLVSVALGAGMVEVGLFSEIDWGNGPFFIQTETDPEGGTSYTITGTTQLVSVPYSLHSNTAETAKQIDLSVSASGDTLFIGENGFICLDGISGKKNYQYPENAVLCSTPNSQEKKDVITATGRVWMDRNLGASRVATSSTDSMAYGDLYQWGRFSDGHQCRNSDETTSLATSIIPHAGNAWDGKFIVSSDYPYDWLSTQEDALWQGVDGMNNPCPEGYRLPTASEWVAEVNTWNSENSLGALASPLKLPVAGYRGPSTGAIVFGGYYGYYWSSSVSGGNSARSLGFGSGSAYLNGFILASGFSVRCIKTIPSSAFPSGTVHCNAAGKTEVVSVTSQTGEIWMDRNLGASRVATSSADGMSYGDLYQWGRFSDGHQCRNSDETTSLATSIIPHAGNAWDEKFIVSSDIPYDWLSTQEDALWQGVDGVNNPCPEGYRLPTASEWVAEVNTWNWENSLGALVSPLKLPAAGARDGSSSGELYYVGSHGFYWSSSVGGSGARGLNFGSGATLLNSNGRVLGYAIRCLKDPL